MYLVWIGTWEPRIGMCSDKYLWRRSKNRLLVDWLHKPELNSQLVTRIQYDVRADGQNWTYWFILVYRLGFYGTNHSQISRYLWKELIGANCYCMPPFTFLCTICMWKLQSYAWASLLLWTFELYTHEHRLHIYDGTITNEGSSVFWRFLVSIRGCDNADCFLLFSSQWESKMGNGMSHRVHNANYCYHRSLVFTRITKVLDRVK